MKGKAKPRRAPNEMHRAEKWAGVVVARNKKKYARRSKQYKAWRKELDHEK